MAMAVVFVSEDGTEAEYEHPFISYPEAFMFLRQNKFKEISFGKFEKKVLNSSIKRTAYIKKKDSMY